MDEDDRQINALMRLARVPERIQERMEVLGLNPYSAAKKAGLGADYVRDILRGKVKHPTAERLGKLAVALETSLQYLMGLQEHQGALMEEGRQVRPPSPLPSAGGEAVSNAVLLPIRFELMADTYRRATEVSRKALGYEAATIPPAYAGRQCWWELLRDRSMAPWVLPGSLVQVVEMDDAERHLIGEGDIIVIQKRIVEETQAAFHLVERSLRIVSYRYPGMGLWFMEYGNESWGISDDVFKEEEVDRKPPRLLPQVMHDEESDLFEPPRSPTHGKHFEIGPETTAQDLMDEGMDPEEAMRSIRFRDIAKRIEGLTPEQLEAELEHHRRWRPRLVGKVIRVLTPIDDKARFGTGSEVA